MSSGARGKLFQNQRNRAVLILINELERLDGLRFSTVAKIEIPAYRTRRHSFRQRSGGNDVGDVDRLLSLVAAPGIGFRGLRRARQTILTRPRISGKAL